MSRLGVLGGTFDPPHLGHLLLAEIAREVLRLDRVLFLPAGEPPHKPDGATVAVADRLAMTSLAIAGNPAFVLDRLDCERPPPHTTVSLLPLLGRAHPAAEFWLLIGGDSLRDLPQWREPAKILTMCRLAVLPRPGATVEWRRLESALPGVRERSHLLDGPRFDLSSTELRDRARQGRSLRYQVPDAVRDYIVARELYRQEPTPA